MNKKLVLVLVGCATVYGCAERREAELRVATMTNNAGMEFVLIHSGRFMMGSDRGDDDELQHEVTITQPFYIGRYEVTQSQWQTLMGNNPSLFKECGGNCPVENVSWNDAEGFVSKLNSQGGDYTYRLPTEAEWEYAARAGTTGDYAGNLDAMAWYDQNSDDRTHPAGTKQANAWGLYDMHGNVFEWCQDWYASGTHRVLRGGSWYASASFARSASRGGGFPDTRFGGYGFRVVAVERTQ